MVREVASRLGHQRNIVRNGRLAIPGTLLISAVSLIDDVSKCITMDFKRPGAPLFFYTQARSLNSSVPSTHVCLHRFRPVYAAMHDISDGGLLTAVAECCIASRLGAEINFDAFTSIDRVPFTRGLTGYVIEYAENWTPDYEFRPLIPLGRVSVQPRLVVRWRG